MILLSTNLLIPDARLCVGGFSVLVCSSATNSALYAFLSWQRIGSYALDCLIDFVMAWCGIIGALSSICSSTSFRILAVLWLQYLKSLQVHDSIATQN